MLGYWAILGFTFLQLRTNARLQNIAMSEGGIHLIIKNVNADEREMLMGGTIDNISIRIIKRCGKSMASLLKLKHFLKTGRGVILSSFMRKGGWCLKSNYHRISLFSIFNKIFKRLTFIILHNF